MDLREYTYSLPQDKIALFPLPRRDRSKLLVYKGGEISHEQFLALADHLPDDAFLFFNNTKVIPARLLFRKESGAAIEIFILNPVSPSPLVAESMAAVGRCSWRCTIGNLKRWNEGLRLRKHIGDTTLWASLTDRREGIVEFRWEEKESFAGIIARAGETPLPPYIKREPIPADRERYQTIYSRFDGAVAAPTAGLHFTPDVFAALSKKNIGHDFVTLHASAGTFQPIKVADPARHIMHEEQVIVSRDNLNALLLPGKTIIPVGTTSMRTLESLYWYGAKLLGDEDAEFNVLQDDPYRPGGRPATKEALEAVAAHMDRQQTDTLVGRTSIFIRPGYDFRVCKGLITNFHQPASTLILLVAAFVGDDWKKIYAEALENDYRFLSYGDSSLLLP